MDLADRAIRIDPNNSENSLIKAQLLQIRGDLPDARAAVDRALVLDPVSSNERLYVTATQIYLDSGKATDAVRIGRHGADLFGTNPKSVPIRYELARALVAIGQPLDALAELDKAIEIRPTDAAVRLRDAIAASQLK